MHDKNQSKHALMILFLQKKERKKKKNTTESNITSMKPTVLQVSGPKFIPFFVFSKISPLLFLKKSYSFLNFRFFMLPQHSLYLTDP